MKYKRQISVLLAIALILGCTGWVPTAAQQNQAGNAKQAGLSSVLADVSNEGKDLKDDILSQVDTQREKELKYVARLHEEETLRTHVYLNNDGSKNLYLYDHPVQYQDEQGKMHDISLDIADTDDAKYPYRTKANSAVTAFPASLSDGVKLTGNGVDLRLAAQVPISSTNINQQVQRLDDQTISYTYDSNTTIEYSLTYTGFKEDIVVNAYTGQTEYNFFLYTNGLTLMELDGSYYLADDAGNIQASVGDVIVFTADERNNTFGEMRATTIKSKQIYALTIVLDEEYLADPKTVYPIRIDPTVSLTYAESGANAIDDVTLHSTSTSNGGRTFLLLGMRPSGGVSRILMKFPGIDFSAYAGVTITSATVSLRDLMCESSELGMACYPFTGSDWEESTAAWDTVTQSWGELLDRHVISYSNGTAIGWRYSFEIKEAVQKWVDGDLTITPEKGIIFKADDAIENSSELESRTLGSFERDNYKPIFTMTYQCGITLSQSSATMYKGDTLSLTATTAPAGQAVTWQSDAPTVASVSDTGLVTALSPGTAIITATILDGITASCEIVVEKTIKFSYNTSIKVYKGNTITLAADTEPAGEPIIWSSLNPGIATVENGVVTGVSPGNAVIRASLSDDIYALCEVEVLATDVYFDCVCGSDCVEDCTCGCPDISIYIEDTVTLTAITVPSGQTVTWESDDPTIATVSQTGMVTGISAGTTKIRACIDQYTFAECMVTINAWQINWDESSIRSAVGDSHTFETTTTPFGKQITWSSSDPTIAVVSQNGEVTGIKAGVVTIKAKLYDGTYATCHVYVKKTGSLNYVQNGVIEGEGFVLTITTQGVSNMTWTSADTSIATVTNQGHVTGVKPGRVKIYVDSPDIIKPLCCVVDVYFKEGIYYIQNTDNSHFVTVQSNRIFDDSPIIQSVNNSERGELYQLAQIWKICHLGNGHYSIRAAHRLNMGLCVKENNDVVLMDIGSIDSVDSVPDAAQWDISYVENAYMISSIIAGVLMPNSNYTSIGTKIICGEGQLGDSCIWNITLTIVSPRILLYDAKTGKYLGDKRVGVIPDEVAALSDLGIIVSEVRNTGVNQGTSYWIPSDPDVAKVDEYTGTVIGETFGVITINIVKNVEGTTCKNTYTLVVSEIKITGYESEYKPDFWNYTRVKYDDERDNWLYIRHYTNCYAYALNNQIDPLGKRAFGCNIEGEYNYESPPTQQPGDIYDTYNTIGDLVELKDVNDSFDASKLKEAVELDFGIYNSKKGKCEYFGELADDIPIDGYKVYLAIRPKRIGIASDYHWYRQNPDGTWSHKRGPTPVTNKDNNGNPIQNPKEAAVLAGYTLEVGYFIVTPWDNLYQPATTLQDVGSSMSSHIYVMHLNKIKYGDELNCSGNRVAASDATQNQKNVSSNLMYELYEKDCYNMRGYFHTSIGVFQIIDIRKKTIKEVNHNV